jgi:hypothetical protein
MPVGPFGPEFSAAVPGRRAAPPLYQATREEGGRPICLGPVGPGRGTAVPREEEGAPPQDHETP